jgi:Cu(I)/Ag(I) efflux system periplasmic protein CusF
MTPLLNRWLATAALTLVSLSILAQDADMTDGEVRKIDKAQSKITLKHGDIKNLDMPGMTMVFVVKDKAMLDKLAPGDKVKFKAVNDAGKFTVTDIQPLK